MFVREFSNQKPSSKSAKNHVPRHSHCLYWGFSAAGRTRCRHVFLFESKIGRARRWDHAGAVNRRENRAAPFKSTRPHTLGPQKIHRRYSTVSKTCCLRNAEKSLLGGICLGCTMSAVETSFRLGPKDQNKNNGSLCKSSCGGAIANDPQSGVHGPNLASKVGQTQATKGEREMTPKSILKTSSTTAVAAAAGPIPGTWGMTMSSQNPGRLTSRTIRATPFEPLVHQRKLPKDGTISPLRINEYYAYQQERLKLPSLHTAGSGDVPPVQEIRIPTPQYQDDSSICSAVGDTATEEHYKNLYFCSQRELHASEETVARVMEENRLLKRRLIEMQKQLFSISRNRRFLAPEAMQNTAWSIPTNSGPPCKKRRKEADSRSPSDSSKRMTTISETSTIGEQPSLPEFPPGISKSVSADAAASTTM